MNIITGIILPILLIALWHILTVTGFIDPLFLPTPESVMHTLIAGLSSGELIGHSNATLLRSIGGFMVASAVGVPIGLLIGRSKLLSQLMQPTIDFFRSVPASALFPLFLFMFGTGDTAKIAVVVYAAALITIVNTAYGAMQVRETRIRAAKVMGATSWDIFWKVIVPESFPGIFAGLRIALSLSFVIIIVTEMFIGTNVGLGYYIINAQMVYRVPEMYAGIALTGLIGYIANMGLLIIQKRVLHWVGR